MTSELYSYWTVALLLAGAAIVQSDDDAVKLIYKVNKLEACPEQPQLPHDYQDIQIEMDPETDTLYVSGTLNATEPLQEGTKGVVTIFKCLTDDERSCERYLELEIEDFCTHLPETNKTWTPVVSHLENFDPHCPVPPGVYQLQDAPLQTSSVKDKYAMQGHWQLEVMVEFDGRMFACLRGDATITIDNSRR